MEEATQRLVHAVEQHEKIGIFGDYDVDGACSAALFHKVLTSLGCDVEIHIPDRFTEGYGPNINALQKLKDNNASLILTVDCGIMAHEPLTAASEGGLDIIVIDHHLAGPNLPKAIAVVNPNRLDDESGFGFLCAAGVCFITCVALLRALRQSGHTELPDLLSFLDLVGLATLCDVVPIESLNRAFIRQGLVIMRNRGNTGLAALADVAGLDKVVGEYECGFVLGPRINAAGRMGKSDIGVKLLLESDHEISVSLAIKLDELNKQRRSIEQEITVHATQQAEAQLEENPDLLVLVLADKSYNEGVLGIVAGRLKELFARPVFVLGVSPDNIAKGSGRSIPSIALGSLVLAARQSGILLTGGGHDMAAGASLNIDKLEEFRLFLAQKISANISVLPQREFEVTATISVAGCTSDLVSTIESCGPFGSGQPEPKLLLTHISVSQVKWVGATKSHFTALLDDGTSRPLKSIMFNVAGTKIGNTLKSVNELGPLKVLGKLKRDEWRGGKSVQFLIEDIARQFD
ncbi:MAG: single-stranded-DNA-specific exonuclease RecJ, partial [Alphaproteobacteria bacterium]|nr:single-stranded-DNA-specific exonuclease RecJ [Alphaproteobacteria bacterium]